MSRTGPAKTLVCFYGPLTVLAPPTLRWTRTLDATQAAALLAVVDAKPQRQGDLVGPINCPKDNGSAAILRFSYAGRPDQDVLVRMTGCRRAASEHGTTMFREDVSPSDPAACTLWSRWTDLAETEARGADARGADDLGRPPGAGPGPRDSPAGPRAGPADHHGHRDRTVGRRPADELRRRRRTRRRGPPHKAARQPGPS